MLSYNMMAMKVSVIGTGYVGLVTAACFAYLGHDVVGLDINEERISKLNNGEIPIYEPGLKELLADTRKHNNFPKFTTDSKAAISHGEFVFIAVGTPPLPSGEPNLEYLQSAAETIGKHLNDGAIVINKSTVPVGSGNWVRMLVENGVKQRASMTKEASAVKEANGNVSVLDKEATNSESVNFTVASNPEFLREGTAILDTLYPDRIVIGAEDSHTAERLKQLYAPLKEQKFREPVYESFTCRRPEGFNDVSIISTDVTSAEMIKYSANAFLPMKISFANEIANICDKVGADVKEVMRGIGTDSRIGSKFLNAGIGWGGSCFPKDVEALVSIAKDYDYDAEILKAIKNVNYRQRDLIIKRLQEKLKILKGRKIGLLGLAFKPNTDDMRDAPAIDIAKSLIKFGAQVYAADPIAIENCQRQFPDLEINYAASVDELVNGLDALVLVTEWDEYRDLPMKEILNSMNGNLFIDGRNQYEPAEMKDLGFDYVGIGRA